MKYCKHELMSMCKYFSDGHCCIDCEMREECYASGAGCDELTVDYDGAEYCELDCMEGESCATE